MKNTCFFRRVNQALCLMIMMTMCLGAGKSYMPGPEEMLKENQPEIYQPEGYRPGQDKFKVTADLEGVEVASSPRVNQLVQEAEETARRLESDVDSKVSSLKQAAEKSIVNLKADIEDRAKQLKKESELEAKKIRERAEQQTDKLFKQASEQAAAVAQKIEKEAIQLKKDAAFKVIDIINKADEESLKLRKKKREDAIIRRLSHQHREDMQVEPGLANGLDKDKNNVTREWRRAMCNEFDANTLLMKQIIMEGEDAEQLPDFLQRFNDQRVWFDRTLRGTQKVDDPNYNQVVNKQIKLRKIVKAQRKADTFLTEVAKNLKLSDHELKKVRLLALYELNAFAQKNEATSRFSGQVIRNFVLKVADEVTGRVKSAYPGFKDIVDSAVTKLAVGIPSTDNDVEVKKLRTMVDVVTQEKNSTKNQFKQKFEEQGKELHEHQLTAKRLEFELDRLRQQAEADKAQVAYETQEGMNRKFGVKLEEKERDNLELGLQLTGAYQQIDVLKGSARVVTENANLQVLNAELREKKHDQITTVSTLLDK